MYGLLSNPEYGVAEVAASIPPSFPKSTSLKIVRPSLPENYEGKTLGNSLVQNTAAYNRGEHRKNLHLSTTGECSDWLKHQLREQSAKIIAHESGIGVRAAEGIKSGRNGLTMAHLVSICRANPEFRAAFFAFCGGQLEGTPELVASLSHAINHVLQQQRAGT